MSSNRTISSEARLKIVLRGAVQGVGFRPFVFRLAEELKLTGWVNNSPQGVFIDVEGRRSTLEIFLIRLEAEKPPRSFIQSQEVIWLDAVGYPQFEIRASETGGDKAALVLPDIGTCPDCLRDIFDPTNRRFRYPFTNCTRCGPRFSLIEALPYDRANTTMRGFPMCPRCQAEYDDPRDRRFHAQPNACPACGPQLEFWSGSRAAENAEPPRGHQRGHAALLAAAKAIRDGQIVAVKGVGGFHLLVDAGNASAIQRLRERKLRNEKPFALMFPSLARVKAVCRVSPLEERLLCAPEAPIVLLQKIRDQVSEIGELAAPGNPSLGVMLPSNPLHHLLMAELDFPVIATSGNLSDEPICTDEREAAARLGGIADAFLVHNRPIVRHVDDSIVRVLLDREMVIRRARGYAPLPIQLASNDQSSKSKVVLAVGAHLKNSVALAVGENVFISQHIGDLETEVAHQAFRSMAGDLPKLFAARPEIIAADLHPDYLSTKFAVEATRQKAGRDQQKLELSPQLVGVQHHVAHVLSCIAENEIQLPVLGVAWDGTGYGPDGTVWGGEFFLVTQAGVERVAHLRPFRLPGGGKAVKEPRRVALGLLYELYGEAAFEMNHLPPLRQMPAVEMVTLRGMLQRRFNAPQTTSVGRLFDAVASLVNLRQQLRFEGQAAMELEFARDGFESEASYNLLPVSRPGPLWLDWSLMIHSILTDVNSGVPLAEIATKFHNALAEAVVLLAKKYGQGRVALSGGCFQNRYLTERTVARLRAEQIQPYWHQRVPTNDGGIALGQIYAVRNHLKLK